MISISWLVMTKAVTEAIILAGGKGTRLRSVTQDMIPKGMTPIQEKPIIEWEFEYLAREGINHVILALGHHSELIEKEFGSSYETEFGNIDLSISIEKEKLGSGGAVKLASSQVNGDRVLLMNGDILTNASLRKLSEIHERTDALASMLLVNMTSPYGVAKVSNDLIVDFVEKPRLDVPIHAGIDIVEREIFSRFPTVGQMEDTIFIELAQERKFAYHLMRNDEFWMSVDTHKDYTQANESWPGLK